jgi:signal transduction histidine kinase
MNSASPKKWSNALLSSAYVVPAAIVAISLVAGAMVFVGHLRAAVQLKSRILEENGLRMSSTLERVEDYFDAVYSTLRFISLDPEVMAMRKGSSDFIQRLYDHQWDQQHLTEIYVVERDFPGTGRPFQTFERVYPGQMLAQIHSLSRELEEYQMQRDQIRRFGADTNVIALISPEIQLCSDDLQGRPARGIVYSVPIRSSNGLAGIVAAMIPTFVVEDVLAKHQYQQLALLINSQGEVFAGRGSTDEAARSWFKGRLAKEGAPRFFGSQPQSFPVGRWNALWAPAQVVCAGRWWLVFLYDRQAYLQRSFFAGTPGTAALAGMLVVAGVALALLAWTAAKRLQDKLRYLDERAQLEHQVQAVSEREQRRVGDALREDLCQRLAGLEAASQALAKGLKTKARAEVPLVAEIAGEIHDALGQAQQLADELQPVSSLEQGLLAAVQKLAAVTQQRSGITCRFEGQELPELEDAAVAAHFYRIAQEVLTNAVQHANAKEITLSLSAREGHIILAIVDDGIGVPPNADQGSGMGLRLMRYRSDAIGARLDVESVLGKGTRVTCWYPLPETAPALQAQLPRSR